MVIVAGSAVLARAVRLLDWTSGSHEWLFLAALTLLSSAFAIKVPSIPATISVSETFVFATVLLFGIPQATVVVALDALGMSIRQRSRQLHKILFSVVQPSLSMWLASEAFFHASTGIRLTGPTSGASSLLVPLLLLTTAYFLLNSGLTALAIALETAQNPVDIWRRHLLWVSLNYFFGASVAALLVWNSTSIDISMIGVTVPLLVVSYLTFKFSMGRVEDANKHMEEVGRLYLSTIETLAMAVDAKDQTTHGHIRRVQAYAIALAEEISIHDGNEIKALQAAALLHDLGKLAVPDYILNKPGALTPAERERMKLHANVGADILSAIRFPYPVVPVVRHHHENWDGTGYPSGLAGADIPLGARILAVVDCFDALTSDRPYRPKLSDGEALEFLTRARGSMYDPLIVDTFVRIYPRLATRVMTMTASGTSDVVSHTTKESEIRPRDQLFPLENIVSGTEEMIELYNLAKSLAGQIGLADTGDMISKHLKRLVPATLCVFYVRSETGTELVARHAVGEGAGVIKGLRIEIGQRLSGWVAANRQIITNSDPALDFGEAGRRIVPRLRSSISVPLVHEGNPIGTLTLYGEQSNQFTEDHKRILEVVGSQVSYAVRSALDFEQRLMTPSPSTGLPKDSPVAVSSRSDQR